MRYVLTRKSEEAVRRFLASPVLLAFDFDGTLAPIVGDPDRARLRPATRRLLRRVADAWPCVVISGRSRADVERKLVAVRKARQGSRESERHPNRQPSAFGDRALPALRPQGLGSLANSRCGADATRGSSDLREAGGERDSGARPE